MLSHHPHEIEKRVRVWLEQVKWQEWDKESGSYAPVNPFARLGSLTQPVRKAEHERKGYLLAEVIKPGMPWIRETEREWLLELCTESHIVLFAADGEGKSACRLMAISGAMEQGILAVEYLEFDQHPRSVKEHAHRIGDRVLQTLREQGRIVPDVTAFGLPEPLVRLTHLNNAAKDQGFKATFVFVDDVEERLGPQPTEDEVERLIENLFAPELLQIPGLYLKVFLPDCLAKRLHRYRAIAYGGYPIGLFHVRWTEQTLRKLLTEKISSVSLRGEVSFLSLSDDGAGRPFEVDKELITMALSQPGAPRILNRLACKLIYAHARNELDPEKPRLTERDLRDAILLCGFEPLEQPQTGFPLLPVKEKYHDLELLVTTDHKIRAFSQQGEEKGKLHLDMNEIGLTLQLIEQERTNVDLLKGLGGKLYQALFPPAIHAHLRATVAAAEAKGQGVRIRLIIESPALAALSWEFLYDANTNVFLANSPQTPLSRYIPVPLPRREIRPLKPPLRILLVISNPKDRPPLDAASEASMICDALAKHEQKGLVEIELLDEATIPNIHRRLQEKAYNVFHFIGHGTYEHEKGYVDLVASNGRARPVDDETFSNLFLGNRALGLVVLNACCSATRSTTRAFTGMASHLVRRGIPAVVAMQYPLANDTAILFSDEFYRIIALGRPVDEATQLARNAIAIEIGLDQRDFATPVLFMRAQNGIIFARQPSS